MCAEKQAQNGEMLGQNASTPGLQITPTVAQAIERRETELLAELQRIRKLRAGLSMDMLNRPASFLNIYQFV